MATFNQLFACTALVLPSRCSSYFRRALIHRKFTFHSVFVDSILNIPLPFNSQLINETAFFEFWDFVLKSQKSFLQRRVPIKRTLCKDFWNEQFNVLFCRFRYPAKDRHQYSNVSSGLFLPHYHCSFEVVKVKEVTTCTFSKALVNEKAVGI